MEPVVCPFFLQAHLSLGVRMIVIYDLVHKTEECFENDGHL